MAELQMLHHAAGLRGRRRHEEAFGREPRGRAIVHHEAVLAQHQAIARPADGQRGERVAIYAVEEHAGIGAFDLDLAQGRDIAHTHGTTRRPHLAADGFKPVRLGIARIILRAQPLARLDEHRALLGGPGMRRREPRWTKILAAMVARNRPEADRHVRRPIGRGADVGDLTARRFGEDGQPSDIGDLALVGRHAERGVALQMLDRAEAFLVGDRDILGGHVVLEVDERLRAARLDLPERRDGGGLVIRMRHRVRRHRETALDCRHRAGAGAGTQAFGQRQRAIRRARDMHAGRQRAGRERRKLLVPHRAAVQMVGQMHGRIPAARHRQRVAFDLRGEAGRIDHIDGLNAARAVHMRNLRADEQLDAKRRELARRLRTRVDHRGDLDAGRARVQSGAPAIVVVGEDRETFARRRRITIDVGACRARQHHAGPIIVAERDHAFERARRQHGAPGHDPPGALARRELGRHGQMIAHAFDRTVLAMIEDAGDSGAAHDPHVGHGGKLGLDRSDPVEPGLVVDRVALRQQAPAEPEILVA